MNYFLAKLSRLIDWKFLEEELGSFYQDVPRPPLFQTRLMAGLTILKHMHDLLDEALCERWAENLYYQLCCSEEFFHHRLTYDRCSITRLRQRIGEEKLTALL